MVMVKDNFARTIQEGVNNESDQNQYADNHDATVFQFGDG